MNRRAVAWMLSLGLAALAASCSSFQASPGVGGDGGSLDGSSDATTPFGQDGAPADGTVPPPGCGSFSQPCCGGSMCKSTNLVCQNGVCGQARMGETGKPCMRNGDCQSGICLPVGSNLDVCTTACSSGTDCVAGWSCSALIGQSSNVCQCKASPEVCNGKDDDCDGIVDNEPAVDQACASQIGAGAVCQGGTCSCGGSTTSCAGRCANTQTDNSNCGGCAGAGGKVCSGGMNCTGGMCGCTGGEILCGSTCVNPQTDSNNCGGCAGAGGRVCTGGTSCSGGTCGCTGGETLCGSTCTNTQADNNNCGGCAGAGGKVCSGGTSCSGGMCVCPSGQTFCGSACTDTQTDPSNCGRCGNGCPGQFSDNPMPTCAGGTCVCEVGPCVTSNNLLYCCTTGTTCYQDFTCMGACCH